MVEQIVYDPTKDVSRKPKKKDPKGGADEALHKGDIEELAEGKINKYGFLHIDKKLAKHLAVSFGKDKADVPVTIEKIPGGFVVKLA
jgi:hypothetical protein